MRLTDGGEGPQDSQLPAGQSLVRRWRVRMGTWGPGNFSDDIALDWLGGLVDDLVADIEKGMTRPEAVCGHALTAQLEVLALLCERLNAIPPKPDEIAAWRETYLQTWETEIDDYDPDPEYKAKRREVIDLTFDRLATVAERWHRAEGP